MAKALVAATNHSHVLNIVSSLHTIVIFIRCTNLFSLVFGALCEGGCNFFFFVWDCKTIVRQTQSHTNNIIWFFVFGSSLQYHLFLLLSSSTTNQPTKPIINRHASSTVHQLAEEIVVHIDVATLQCSTSCPGSMDHQATAATTTTTLLSHITSSLHDAEDQSYTVLSTNTIDNSNNKKCIEQHIIVIISKHFANNGQKVHQQQAKRCWNDSKQQQQ